MVSRWSRLGEESAVLPISASRDGHSHMSLSHPNCVAITGLGTFLGTGLAERLLELPGGPHVVGIDPQRPLGFSRRMSRIRPSPSPSL